MTTPAIMLGLLVAPFVILTIAGRLTGRSFLDPQLRGCIGLALVFCFTGVGHFINTEPMAAMIPSWVPRRVSLVYATGIIEIAAAIAVLVPRIRRRTGWALIVLLLLFLPVNIYAAANRIGMGGHRWGPGYLLIRVPLQAILVGWTWWFTARSLRKDDREKERH